MKMYLLSDNVDTHTGMHLAGIRGEVIHSRPEFEEAFGKAVSRADIGIVLVTEKLAELGGDLISNYVKANASPLITVIPDRHAGEKEAVRK